MLHYFKIIVFLYEDKTFYVNSSIKWMYNFTTFGRIEAKGTKKIMKISKHFCLTRQLGCNCVDILFN